MEEEEEYALDCVAYEYCYNGDIYRTVYGTSGSSGAYGYDSRNDCYYCFTYDYCYYPEYGTYKFCNIVDHLGISVVTPSECDINKCYIKVYCGGYVFAQGCGDCNTKDCLNGFRGSKELSNADTTYSKENGKSIMHIEYSGLITDYSYVDLLLKENVFDSLTSVINQYEIFKSWKIIEFSGQEMTVMYFIKRDEQLSNNPITNETDTVQAINIRIERILKKEK